MDSEYLRQLKSSPAAIRKKAWSELHLQPFAGHGVLSGEVRAILAEVLRNEDDEDVHRMAVDTLLSFSCCDCG
jgi:hypothetical protein